MVIMKKIIVFAVMAPALLLLCLTPVLAGSGFEDVAARSALLVETETGMVLYEHNAETRRPPDAMVKVMTLLLAVVACENGSVSPDDVVVMTESAHYNIDSSSTTQSIMPGEEMTLLDLMYCAYIGGANEACNLIAEHISGSVGAFITGMNRRAGELGCISTYYTNANGLYSGSHYTTAMDQYAIFREALTRPLFAEIAGTYEYTVEETNMSEARRLINANGLLNSDSKYHYMPTTAGMASYVGFLAADVTAAGGYSFVAAAESNDLSLICVVLGAEAVVLEDESVEMQNLTEARRLFEWGYSQFSLRTVLSTDGIIARAPIMHGAGADFVNLRPESSITILLNNDIPDSYFERVVTIYSIENNDVHYAPVHVDDVLGEVMIVGLGGEEYGPVLLLANTNIELHRMQFIRMRISDMLSSTAARVVIWILAIIVLAYIALVVRYNILRRKRLRKNAEARKRLKDEKQGINSEKW